MDDPFVIASLLPPSIMLEAQKLRWTLCATDRCFTNPVLSTFFRSVKVLPVSRGEGIYQKVSKLRYIWLAGRFSQVIAIKYVFCRSSIQILVLIDQFIQWFCCDELILGIMIYKLQEKWSLVCWLMAWWKCYHSATHWALLNSVFVRTIN
jgi:hypothetical protein